MFDSAFEAILREHHLSPRSSTEPLSDTFLEDLVAEVDNEHIRGIVLGGSQARGDATPYSDVDLACFVSDTFRPLRKRFMYREGYLISVVLKTLEDIKQQLTHPYQALWTVPSFRQARVLLDKDGSMAQLKQMVEDFSWEALRSEAIGFAGHILICDVEFVHKLFGNIWKNNLSGAAYTTTRIFDGATMCMASYYGVFITTESLHYEEVERAVGLDAPWTHYHRLLIGVETNDEDTTSIEARAKLALRLYRETATLLWPTLSEQRSAVIQQVLLLIEQIL